MFEKLKGLIRDESIYMAITIIVVAFASFGLGRLSVQSVSDTESSIRVEYPGKKPMPEEVGQKIVPEQAAAVVASRNSTKYHLITCPGAKQISEANKITFSSTEAAEAAGLVRAANCK